MFKTTLANSYLKRTIRPLYANTQSTPKSVFLDPTWAGAVDIYPGMALCKGVGGVVAPLGWGGNLQPYGLSAFFQAPALGITEIGDQGVNAAAAWVLGPDAEFQILAPAFDVAPNGGSWTDAGTSAPVLVFAYTAGAKQGQLHPAGTTTTGGNTVGTVAIGRVLSVDSATQITIGGLVGSVA